MRFCSGLVLAVGVVGCADDDPSYDAGLIELASELRVTVEVLGTPDPPTPRRIRVLLDPGPSATLDQDHLCPVIEAYATLNGFALEQTQKGEYFSSSGGGGILSGYSGCYPITFERALPEELPPELLEEPARVLLLDATGLVRIDVRGLFHPVRATFVSPPDGVLKPGSVVTLGIEPSTEMLPPRLSGYYTAEVPGDSFGLGSIDIHETGIAFRVLENAVPSSGTLEITGDRAGAFRGIVDVCQGAAVCAAERSICAFGASCSTGVAYGDGFDSLILPASVARED